MTSALMLTDRELFLLIIGATVYAALFVVTVQNSRRRVVQLQERLEKIRLMQEDQQAQSRHSIAANEQKIRELERLLQRLGDENSVLRLQIEERKATLDYRNKLALIESEKREQAESAIFSSEVYRHVQACLADGRTLAQDDWTQLTELVNSVYTGFTEKLYSLYRLTDQDYRVSLLTKIRLQPRDIALLTAHSKESVATTRSRLYQKVFGKKGSSKDWDEFILSI